MTKDQLLIIHYGTTWSWCGDVPKNRYSPGGKHHNKCLFFTHGWYIHGFVFIIFLLNPYHGCHTLLVYTVLKGKASKSNMFYMQQLLTIYHFKQATKTKLVFVHQCC